MTNVTVSDNRASYGGGFFATQCGMVLTNVRIEANTATSQGGGIYHVLGSAAIAARSVLVMTNGIIRGNTAVSYGGGIYNTYGFTGSGTAYLSLRMALTNVLIADNEGRNGGGIYNNSSPGSGNPGKGISILLNNVTITNNTATAPFYSDYTNGGGGIYIPLENDSTTNKVTVIANNSIIWDNKAPNNSTPAADSRANIYNPTEDRLILNNCLAPNPTTYGKYDDKNTTEITSSPFTSGYYTNSTGLSSLYPTDMGTLIGNNPVGTNNGALEIDTSDNVSIQNTRYSVFTDMINREVFNSGAINRDAPPAAGTGTASAGAIRKNGAIDVGAYEKQ
jgi:hypothetical protein